MRQFFTSRILIISYSFRSGFQRSAGRAMRASAVYGMHATGFFNSGRKAVDGIMFQHEFAPGLTNLLCFRSQFLRTRPLLSRRALCISRKHSSNYAIRNASFADIHNQKPDFINNRVSIKRPSELILAKKLFLLHLIPVNHEHQPPKE